MSRLKFNLLASSLPHTRIEAGTAEFRIQAKQDQEAIATITWEQPNPADPFVLCVEIQGSHALLRESTSALVEVTTAFLSNDFRDFRVAEMTIRQPVA